MSRTSPALTLWLATAIAGALGCAKADPGGEGDGGGGGDGGGSGDAGCGDACDQDGDGVPDASDQCPDTPAGSVVNQVGCADSQVTPTLAPEFPPYGLTWTPTGELGRAGGLTWTYTGIQRADRFHIYWVVCDDPATPCGLSLDGPIDVAAEHWQFSAGGSDLIAGRLYFTLATGIALADGSTRPLSGRLTVRIVDASDAPLRFAELATLGVPGRAGQFGAEIPGVGFTVHVLAEVQDTLTSTWTPYLDYYDAAPTAEPGGGVTTSFGGSFYDE